MIIGHDPGHGMPPAVMGVVANGIVERDAVWSVGQNIVAGIPWVQHVLLRKQDGTPDYAQRARDALTAGCQFVFCHHINEDQSNPSTRGTITFYDPTDPIGMGVAQAITAAAPPLLRRNVNMIFPCSHVDWTARTDWVIEHYRNVGIPCCLIEWGFASNQNDAAYLLGKQGRPGIVSAVEAGITRAMELLNAPDLLCQDHP